MNVTLLISNIIFILNLRQQVSNQHKRSTLHIVGPFTDTVEQKSAMPSVWFDRVTILP